MKFYEILFALPENIKQIRISRRFSRVYILPPRKSEEDNEAFALRCLSQFEKALRDAMSERIFEFAVIANDEAIVTLMSGCGVPRADPLEFRLEFGEAWLVRTSAHLWQRGNVFEVVGKCVFEDEDFEDYFNEEEED